MFWLWRYVRDENIADYASHMDDSFGEGHLGNTVLPNTVSVLTSLDRNLMTHSYFILIFRDQEGKTSVLVKPKISRNLVILSGFNFAF